MWPRDDSTVKLSSRNRAMVDALVGDSTMTTRLGAAAVAMGSKIRARRVQVP